MAQPVVPPCPHSHQQVVRWLGGLIAIRPPGDAVQLPRVESIHYLLAILPIMTYAAHAVHLTRTDIKTMESTHGNIIKSSLGLSKYSRTSPLIASLDIQRVESVINNQTINLLRRCLMGDSLAAQFYWTLYKQGELDDKTLIGRASHLMQKNELTFTKTIFNDIFHVNTKSVLFEHVPHGSNGLIDSLRVIFNDYDTDNMNYARMLLRF